MKHNSSNKQREIFSKHPDWKKFFIRDTEYHEAKTANSMNTLLWFPVSIIFYFGVIENRFSLLSLLMISPGLLMLVFIFLANSKKMKARKTAPQSEVILNQMPVAKGHNIEFCLILPCESEMFVSGSFRLKYFDLGNHNSDEKPKATDFIFFESYKLGTAIDLDFDSYSIIFDAISIPNAAIEDIRTLNWFLEFQLENNFGKQYKLDFPMNVVDSNDPIYIEENIEFLKLKNEILSQSVTM